MTRLVFGGTSFAALLAAWAVAACDAPAEEAEPGTVTPPLCNAVVSFGNGAQCVETDSKIAACGTSKRRTCASGWLCFDAPELADCGCAIDADCQGRAAYINAGRTAAGKAPLAAKCDGGRCAGAP